jgi:hypothetical protein
VKYNHDKYPMIVGGKYTFIANKALQISPFFTDLEAFLVSCDLEVNEIELKINYHVPLYWRGTYEMFIANWQSSL